MQELSKNEYENVTGGVAYTLGYWVGATVRFFDDARPSGRGDITVIAGGLIVP